MRFTSIASVATLLTVAVADYNIWYRVCGSGLAKLDAISVSDRQGVCYAKSCAVTGQLGAGDARGGNPVSFLNSHCSLHTNMTHLAVQRKLQR